MKLTDQQLQRLALGETTIVGPLPPKLLKPKKPTEANPDLFDRYANTPACGGHCVESRRCICTDRPHKLHICKNPDCSCHSRARYEGWK